MLILVESLDLWGCGLRPAPRYFWRSVPLDHRTGSDIFSALFGNVQSGRVEDAIAVLLESPYPLPENSLPKAATAMARYSICAGRPRSSEGEDQVWIPERGGVLPLLKRLGEVALPEAVVLDADGEDKLDPDSLLDHLPFTGGWLGWLGYDLAWEIERLPWLKDDKLPFPTAFWYEPAQFAVLDHHLQALWLASDSLLGLDRLVAEIASLSQPSKKISNATASESTLHSDDFSSIYIGEKNTAKKSADRSLTGQFQLETDKAAFEAAVNRAKAYIRAGDVFQVNHSVRFWAQTRLCSWAVYKKLQAINPSPFASYWRTPWGAVVSCSPERLVRLADGRAESRPIAGTRPRGATPAADADNMQILRRDVKEQAEHIMLVDLERNDLGRVCEWGSVRVEELMTIERYSHVMHLVSNVVGELAPQHSVSELVAALFPGGTITGCPKVRCMEIIEALEPVRRSLFYGSCGYLDRRGRLDLNILIRTLLMARPNDAEGTATVWGQVGAGIVADSNPEREWFESLQKAKAQLLALGL